MRRLLPVVTILSTIILFTSCSKEKKTERMITRKDGQWEIKKLNIRTYEEWSPGADYYIMVDNYGYANCGTMKFDKNSNAMINLNLNGDTENLDGKWINGEASITIISDSITRIYEIKKQERKEMNLVYRYDYTMDDYNYYTEYTYEMERN